MDLKSNRTLQLEKGQVYLNNVALVAGNYADVSAINTAGYTMLALRVDTVSGVGLKLDVRGNITNSNLKPLELYNSDFKRVTEITATGLYFVSVSGINNARVYCLPANTATNVTVRVSQNFTDLVFQSIEKRKKLIQIGAKWVDCPANDVAEYFWNQNLDVSEFSYVLIRVRTRDATINTYETRDFKVDVAWSFDVAENVSSADINGGTPLETVIDETAAKDSRTAWIECISPSMSVILYNGEATVKRYEINVIGIR